jgi:multicomponent Na+:H+ antiporter subunit C
MELLIAVSVGLMFGFGIFQILRRNLIRSAIGFFILSNAINLFLLSAGADWGEVAAYVEATGQRSDALPQALVLTAIVIAMGMLALLLAMLYIVSVRYQTSDQDEVKGLQY